jgi:hypothetical protein
MLFSLYVSSYKYAAVEKKAFLECGKPISTCRHEGQKKIANLVLPYAGKC